ncbi:MAG: hypothetical protein ACR2OO_10730 [Thermomicrobiales bacterium]
MTALLVDHYIERLGLDGHSLRVTTEKRRFESWLGRRVSGAIGGAFVFLPRSGGHTILINLPRIDPVNPKSLEIVVAEELLHMRDHIDGDRRRHARHGYDRIAHRVAALTGTSLEEVRNCLVPTERRPFRHVYACPSCGVEIARRRRGTWSCGRCASGFDRRLVLRLIRSIEPPGTAG